ncbi:RNA-directed DNA polymerase [Rhizobium sp. CG5]|uniref:RNA-directed DNA polymerase n=1 Tax=Agrobacterium vitis TaxID=373 RepID=A0AAE4WHW2_AGRVI|nr:MULTISPECIES: reverse transcriptase family protein [Rhizobium/Agrobacterium group]MCM2476182.1 RNA-directed DNA polymerase [Rhizobium sp. CG5]MUZ60559.1 RNA-directed DNA polymerase [Agrobacterium vitis]
MAWNSQRFVRAGELAGVDAEILNNAVSIAEQTLRVQSSGPPILTLGHLGHLSGQSVKYLRSLVSREGEDPYRQFTIRKRPVPNQPPRLRFIAVPEPQLMNLMRWILSEILEKAPCHPASSAFAPESKLYNAAFKHRGAQWLIKVDVRDFFESITEIDVYRVFLERGYQPLTALELARICTRLRDVHREKGSIATRNRRSSMRTPNGIGEYNSRIMGTLAQGAPTSPMLANLAVRPLDEKLQGVSEKFNLRYTRYADDIILSTTDKTFGRERSIQLVGEIYAALGLYGLAPNTSKTLIVPPGARKVVLGLLVDGSKPKLTREFRAKMRMHLHFLLHEGVGPKAHAANRGFSSVEGLRQHLLGLIAFAGQVDLPYAMHYKNQFRSIEWNVDGI